MAQLAIQGHPTRGSEVVALLEMLGGINSHNLYGDENFAYYTIDSDKEIKGGIYVFGDEQLCLFTIEDFLEKYPYKVGDKVEYIKYDNECPDVYTICNMKWTGNTIEYTLDSFGLTCLTKDIRLYKKPKKSKGLESLNVETYLKVWNETENGLEICVVEGYEMIEKDGQFYIVKQKTKYPRDFDECCEVLNTHLSNVTRPLGWKENLISKFQKLIICRDAYWKIAGEQMGLGKPWVLPFNENQKSAPIYFIVNKLGEIYKDVANIIIDNRILAFPTEEMRDTFYENFKKEIEQCKELL